MSLLPKPATISPITPISISCWNCLADSYTYNIRSGSSSSSSSSSSNDWEDRKPLLSSILTESNSDFIFLQEVDHYNDFYRPLLESLNKDIIYVQRNYKNDGNCIAYNNDRFILIEYQPIYFDDLSNIISINSKDYLKHNIGIMAKFKDKYNYDKEFVASTAHIYWNPAKQHIKRAQAYYLKKRVVEFASNLPMIICGDFNSLPDSNTINIISQGKQRIVKGNSYSFPVFDDDDKQNKKDMIYKGNATKFICDDSLNKLCRRMRLLGIDCALETIDSKILRTSGSSKRGCKENYKILFDQAIEEQRVILTTSKLMREIASCPQSKCINTRNLDQALLEICEEYEIDLEPSKFLTVCGKCGGAIDILKERNDHRLKTVTLPQDDRPIYACVKCSQPYWWSNGENSSPARAMRKASEIYDNISKAKSMGQSSVEIESNTDLNVKFKRRDDIMKEIIKTQKTNIDIDSELEALKLTNNNDTNSNDTNSNDTNSNDTNSNDTNSNDTNIIDGKGDTIDDIELCNTYFVYNGKHPEYTNWLNDFKGVLDYIYVSKDWKINYATIYPNNDNPDSVLYPAVSKSLPSDRWPSDHLMLKSIVMIPI